MRTEILTKTEIDAKYDMLASDLKDEFINHMIPYWQGLTDREYGGFYGVMNQNLSFSHFAFLHL